MLNGMRRSSGALCAVLAATVALAGCAPNMDDEAASATQEVTRQVKKKGQLPTPKRKVPAAREACRIAVIAWKRTPIYQGSMARLGATSKEQRIAAQVLRKRAYEECNYPGKFRAQRKRLGKVVSGIETRFATEAGLSLEEQDTLFLDVLVDDLLGFENRCFDGIERDASELMEMSDAEFEASIDELAWGNCRSSDGAGAGLASWSPDARVSYADCVREGMLDGLNSSSQTCNIAGGDGPDGEQVPDPEPPAQDPADSEPTPEEPVDTDEPAPPGSSLAEDVVEKAAAFTEMSLGLAGIATGTAVLVISVAAAMETGGLSLGGLLAANFLIRQGAAHAERGWGRLWNLCPNLDTNAGSMGFAGSGDGDLDTTFSVSDVLHECRCATASEHPDTDPTGELGNSCDGDMQDRLACQRTPYDETGVMTRECAELLAEDNSSEFGERAAACSTMLCGTDMVMTTDCSCVLLGEPGSLPGGGFGGLSCETMSCPGGSVPVSDGGSCRCSDDLGPNAPGAGGFDGPGFDLDGVDIDINVPNVDLGGVWIPRFGG